MILLYLLALVADKALAAPTASTQPQIQLGSFQNTSLSMQFTQHSAPSGAVQVTTPLSVVSALPTTVIASPQLSHSSDPFSTFPFFSGPSVNFSSFLAPSTLFTPPPVSTRFITEVATAFETTTIPGTPPSTTIFTVVVTATAITTVTPSPFPTWGNRTAWAAPPQMTDLSAFNITYFPSGQRNLHLVAKIPAQDIAPSVPFLQNASSPAAPTFLQLVYPAHSVNPGSKPVGGADFYATPLNLAGARNVTLTYTVFFPADFNWVKGGKLPGLFGGHTGCSGGSSARDCFSTRLMWRPKGVGELYLYAPKDEQTTSLCEDPESVCDSAYGFSIGRGSFNFTPGDWTRLQQNVVLNTPGKNDGVFTLLVDGRLAINRTDILYRDVAEHTSDDDGVPQNTEFLGLFFSTFFGGHGKKYATPKQQYTCFKDFAITRHD